MPYILRDGNKRVVRAALQTLHGAEMVSYDHPDLVAFLETHGQDHRKIENNLAALRRTDGDMARAVEDVIRALLKKNILKMIDLPLQVQERMSARLRLRMEIQDAFDAASNQTASSHTDY